MKTIVLLLTCATLCGCGVLQDKYKYTKMHELHTKQHIIFNQQYQDCGYCTRDKAEQAKSMLVEKSFDVSTSIL